MCCWTDQLYPGGSRGQVMDSWRFNYTKAQTVGGWKFSFRSALFHSSTCGRRCSYSCSFERGKIPLDSNILTVLSTMFLLFLSQVRKRFRKYKFLEGHREGLGNFTPSQGNLTALKDGREKWYFKYMYMYVKVKFVELLIQFKFL